MLLNSKNMKGKNTCNYIATTNWFSATLIWCSSIAVVLLILSGWLYLPEGRYSHPDKINNITTIRLNITTLAMWPFKKDYNKLKGVFTKPGLWTGLDCGHSYDRSKQLSLSSVLSLWFSVVSLSCYLQWVPQVWNVFMDLCRLVKTTLIQQLIV